MISKISPKFYRLSHTQSTVSLIFILVMLFVSVCLTAQTITYNSLPSRLKLFARDSQDSSVVLISGTISTAGYDSIYTKLFKSVGASSNLIKVTSSGILRYSGGSSSFTLSPKIHAELAEYKIELYAAPTGTLPASHILLKSIDSLVCGDAFIIGGQSNSHPANTAATYQNEFCRTIGIQTGNTNYDPYNQKDTLWGYANGHGFGGYFSGPYLVGVWGIRLMQYIKDSFNIPVCIINGGTGSSNIQENLPLSNHLDLSSIYGKLLYRVQKAGLQNNIRAIFWYQGESDGSIDTSVYSARFNTLYNAWKSDYAPVNKIYVMQLHHGNCAAGGKLREHQRTLNTRYADIETVSTMNLPANDGCHFGKPGYDTLSYRLFRLVARDFYGSPVTAEIRAPNIAHVYYTNRFGKNIRLLFSNTSNLSLTSYSGQNIKDYFYLDGIGGNVAEVSARDNIATLNLSSPVTASSLTYLPDAFYNNTNTVYQGPYIINPNNIGALSFYGKAIENQISYASPVANFGYNASQAYVSSPINLIDSSLEWPTTYAWVASGGTLSSANIQNPVLTYNTAGTYSVTLTVTNSFGSNTVTKTIIVGSATGTPVYRINAGGGQITNSIGVFSADAFYSPSPGDAYTTTSPIGQTTDDAIYQSERSGSTGTFSYNFPVNNGRFSVVLHFAEIYYGAANNRLFDVSLEGNKVLDNYDIFQRAGSLNAIKETFTVNVADGMLNINFSSLPAEGGKDRAKISAIEILTNLGNQVPLVNAGNDVTIALPANSTTLTGTASDLDGTIAGYAWTKFSGPAQGTIQSANTASTNVTGLVQGTYIFRLTVTDNNTPTPGTAFDDVMVTVNAASTVTAVYRINAGGGQVTNSIGAFSADAYYLPSPGDTYTTSSPIGQTTDDNIYQSERSGSTGTFSYNFPVSNGLYTVVLHFAEIYYGAVNNRVFDVSLEGNKVLDNYDIVQRAGSLNAIKETFTVSVADGMLNINFSSLPADGGRDRAKISAIEILTNPVNQLPVVNAGNDITIILPVNSTTLTGTASDLGGMITGYSWTKFSGPAQGTIQSANSASTNVTGLVQGTYVFRLTVTDNNTPTPGTAFDDVMVTVNTSSTVTAVYRINAGGGQVTNSIGVFSADAFYSPSPGDTYTTSSPIGQTTDDGIYQSERSGSTGTFNYNFPVSNGLYTVILHFAEIYYGATNNRVFDVSLEGNKVLDNYDIFQRAGSLNAIKETFTVNVADGMLNINFSSLPADGGKDRAKISAIEILTNPGSAAAVANVISNETAVTGAAVQRLTASVQPNPAAHHFNIYISGNNNPVGVKIFNTVGQMIEAKTNISAGSTLRLGNNYRPGLYYAVIMQGVDKVILKLIKTE